MAASSLGSGRIFARMNSFIDKIQELISEFEQMSHEMASFHTKTSRVKMFGTAIASIGAVGGALAAFMATAPISVPVAIGAAVLGTTTNVVSHAVDENATSKCKRNIERLLQDFDEDFQGFRVIFQYLAENVFIQMNESKACFDAALEIILAAENNLAGIRSTNQQPTPIDLLRKVEFTKYGFLLVFIGSMVEEGAEIASFCENIFAAGLPCNISFSSLPESFSVNMIKSIAVINLVLQVAEIASVIHSAMQDHVTCETIGHILEKLRKINIQLSAILVEMKQARENGLRNSRVHVGFQSIDAAVIRAYAAQ